MRLNRFIEGLQILSKYYDKLDGHHTGAEHDQFYAYQTDRPLTDEDLNRMVELGWFQPECGFESAADYKPSEGWSAFT